MVSMDAQLGSFLGFPRGPLVHTLPPARGFSLLGSSPAHSQVFENCGHPWVPGRTSGDTEPLSVD